MIAPDSNGTPAVPSSAISDNDVLCGRGGSINCHAGNENFRQLVQKKKRIYLTARFKREKRLIASSIVEEIHSMTPPGRFLCRVERPRGYRKRGKKNEDLGWYQVNDDKARDKTSQALRERAPEIRKEIEVERKQTVMVDGNQFEQDDDYDDKPEEDDEMNSNADNGNGSPAGQPMQGDNVPGQDGHGWQIPPQWTSSWTSIKDTAYSTASSFINQPQTPEQISSSAPDPGSAMNVSHSQPHPGHSPNERIPVVRFDIDGTPTQSNRSDSMMDKVAQPWEQHAEANHSRMNRSDQPSNDSFRPYQPTRNDGRNNPPPSDPHRTGYTSYGPGPYKSENQYHHYPPSQQAPTGHDPSHAMAQQAHPSYFSPPNHHSVENQRQDFPQGKPDWSRTETQPHSFSAPNQARRSHNDQPHRPVSSSSNTERYGRSSHTGYREGGPDINPVSLDAHMHLEQDQQGLSGKRQSYSHWNQSGYNDPRNSSKRPMTEGQNQLVPNSRMKVEEQSHYQNTTGMNEERRAIKNEPHHESLVETREDAFPMGVCDFQLPAALFGCGSMSRTNSQDDFSCFMETCSIDSPLGGASLCNVFIENEPHNDRQNRQQTENTNANKFSFRTMSSFNGSDRGSTLSPTRSNASLDLGSDRSQGRHRTDGGDREAEIPVSLPSPIPTSQFDKIEPMPFSWDGKKVNE